MHALATIAASIWLGPRGNPAWTGRDEHSDLSPAAVARRQRISDSYIRKLFEGEGSSFSEFVLTRRLARAHCMLTDQRWADRSIAWIAFQSGFGDLSYFNRTFKRFYMATPSELRAAIDRRMR